MMLIINVLYLFKISFLIYLIKNSDCIFILDLGNLLNSIFIVYVMV